MERAEKIEKLALLLMDQTDDGFYYEFPVYLRRAEEILDLLEKEESHATS